MKRLAILVLPALLASTAAWAQSTTTDSTDPIVKRRMENKAAKERYQQQKADARAEYKAERKANRAEQRASGATGASAVSPANNEAPMTGKGRP